MADFSRLSLVREFPWPAWAVASCSSGPQAGKLPKLIATEYRWRVSLYMQLFWGADRASDHASSRQNTAKAQHCISVSSDVCQHLKLADPAGAKHQHINSKCTLTLFVPFKFETGPSSQRGSAVLAVEKDHRIDEKRRHVKKKPVAQLQGGPTEFYSGNWSILERSLSIFKV